MFQTSASDSFKASVNLTWQLIHILCVVYFFACRLNVPVVMQFARAKSVVIYAIALITSSWGADVVDKYR